MVQIGLISMFLSKKLLPINTFLLLTIIQIESTALSCSLNQCQNIKISIEKQNLYKSVLHQSKYFLCSQLSDEQRAHQRLSQIVSLVTLRQLEMIKIFLKLLRRINCVSQRWAKVDFHTDKLTINIKINW